jgi:hypothetical protein
MLDIKQEMIALNSNITIAIDKIVSASIENVTAKWPSIKWAHILQKTLRLELLERTAKHFTL